MWEVIILFFHKKKNKFISDDKKVSEMLNSYFDNIAMTLDVKENVYITKTIPTDMEKKIKLLQNSDLPSVLLIKEKVNNLHITFYFKENEVIIEICSLILKKLELTMT